MEKKQRIPINSFSLKIHFEAGIDSANNFLRRLGFLRSPASFTQDSKDKPRRCIKGFPCGNSCQKRGYKCANPLPGQFATYREYVDNGVAKFLSTPEGVRDARGYLAVARSIARNPSERARRDVVNRLRKQAEKDENLHAFFEKIGLEDAISSPAKFARNLAKASLITEPTSNKVELRFSLKVPKVEQIANIDGQIDSIGELKPTENNALSVAKEFQDKINTLNGLIASIDRRASVSDSEYETNYTKINDLTKEFFSLKKKAVAEYAKVREPTLSKILSQISGISAENLPGHKLALINSIGESEKKNAVNPC